MKRTSEKTFAEFFAGIGLMRLGLERAGWSCEFANDNDPRKVAIYTENFGSSHLVVGDIQSLKPSSVPKVALATASFPCTDLSLAGMRGGLDGAHSGTFFCFTHLIQKMRSKPELLLIENVPGLLSMDKGKAIAKILTTLNSLGYRVDIFTIDARWFVPQSRQRLFILGVKTREAGENRQNYERRDERLKPAAVQRVIESAPRANWRFTDIPYLPDGASRSISDIVDTSPACGWWSDTKVKSLLGQMNPKHKKRLFDLAADKYNPRYRAVYRRIRNGVSQAEVRRDDISGCLRTPRGGSSRQILVSAGNGKINARYMTAREYARLQGAPESFVLPGSESSGLFGFGDAVCVPVIEWIADNVLERAIG